VDVRAIAKVHVTMTKIQGTGAGALPSVDSYFRRLFGVSVALVRVGACRVAIPALLGGGGGDRISLAAKLGRSELTAFLLK
jgi:hypothetical protein